VETRVGPFRDIVIMGKIGAQFVSNVSWAWQSFWAHLMEPISDVGEMKARFGPFKDSVNLDA
jgi:hypothetical protein